jgi:hypothetical protein
MERATQQIDEFLEVTQRVINDCDPFTEQDRIRATALLEFWQEGRACTTATDFMPTDDFRIINRLIKARHGS